VDAAKGRLQAAQDAMASRGDQRRKRRSSRRSRQPRKAANEIARGRIAGCGPM
jgi:hypothetical protein